MEFEKTIISVASNNQETMEKACADVIRGAKGMGLLVYGPSGVKNYDVDVKAPLMAFEKGAELFGDFKMPIYQRLFYVLVYPDFVKEKIIPSNVQNVSIEIKGVNVPKCIAHRDCINSGKIWSKDWEKPSRSGSEEEDRAL